jgi:mRNA-degrading endonuclease YafQ of YafQ-DinJ toxin-antitoxin module
MYEIFFTKKFEKRAKKFFKKHPELKERYKKTIHLLAHNPFHPSLRLHKLKGDLAQFHSVSLDMQHRIILDFVVEGEKIYLIDIGTHDEVYGS